MNGFKEDFNQQFFYYKVLAEKVLAQVDDKQFFHQFDETNNSIALLISHLSGNIISRWTNFQTEDGEKSWRKRDGEFEVRSRSRKELMADWEKGFSVVENELEKIEEKDLSNIVYIRNEGHTILQALMRQSNHLALHVGQIIHQAKLLKINDFETLSIPKGKSEEYNLKKMGEGKGVRNFTEKIWEK